MTDKNDSPPWEDMIQNDRADLDAQAVIDQAINAALEGCIKAVKEAKRKPGV
jgi:hypothetical protein